MERLQSTNFRDELSRHHEPLPFADLKAELTDLTRIAQSEPMQALERGLLAFNRLTSESQLPDLDDRIYSVLTAEKSRLGGIFFDNLGTYLDDDTRAFSEEYGALLSAQANTLYAEGALRTSSHWLTQSTDPTYQPNYKNYYSIKPLSSLLLFEQQKQTSVNKDISASAIIELCQSRYEFQRACDEPNLNKKQERLNNILERLIESAIDDRTDLTLPVRDTITSLLTARAIHDLAMLNEFASDTNPNQSRNNAIAQSIIYLESARNAFDHAQTSLSETISNFWQIREEIDYFHAIYAREIAAEHSPTQHYVRLGAIALTPTFQRAA